MGDPYGNTILSCAELIGCVSAEAVALIKRQTKKSYDRKAILQAIIDLAKDRSLKLCKVGGFVVIET